MRAQPIGFKGGNRRGKAKDLQTGPALSPPASRTGGTGSGDRFQAPQPPKRGTVKSRPAPDSETTGASTGGGRGFSGSRRARKK